MRGLRALVATAVTFGAACTTFAAEPERGAGAVDGGTPDASIDGPVACVDACLPASCASWDFAGTDCPADLEVNGDPQGAGSSATCDGELRLVATGTLDKTAALKATSPTTLFTVRVGVAVTVAKWQGTGGEPLTMLQVLADGKVVASLRATSATTNGDVEYSTCLTDNLGCVANLATVPKNTRHRLAFEVDAAGVTLFLDCRTLMKIPAVNTLPTTKPFKLRMGANGGDPMDARFDDVTIAFTRL